MKKIIDGKLYNTATATLIITLYSGARNSQRDYYRTAKGAFFVHYLRVNAMDVIPEDTMKALLMEYDVDKYLELFGDEEEIEEG